MPDEGMPVGLAVHATAVAIGDRALVIIGRSGSGKSRLALALIAASTPRQRIVLVGDDRILLTPGEDGLAAQPHPRIAGFVERRGLGLVAMAWRASALLAGVASLDEDVAGVSPWQENLPVLRLVAVEETRRAVAVLRWWQGLRHRSYTLAEET